jgi:NADPH:quinone reductase-like Zn-dependent oxidoreductase
LTAGFAANKLARGESMQGQDMDETLKGQALRSRVTEDAKLRISLEDIEIGAPGAGEIVVRVEASPINPSDLGTLVGPADASTFRNEDGALVADIPAQRMAGMKTRIGQALAVGNEGAGTVVQAGPDLQHLVGRTVAMLGGGMYASYRKLPAADTWLLPEGAAAIEGASMFINPRTALGFVETLRAEGHKAMVHTAAASNLGQMLVRICQADNIPLVCIVRSPAQVALLTDIGATHVVDSGAADFRERLIDAIDATGATIAFDAVGGGELASQIVEAMEVVAARGLGAYNRYGSGVLKQAYIYGTLDPGPTIIHRVGYSWNVDGWLLTAFLQKAGPETAARLRQRIIDERETTFASAYTATISLADALKPDIAAAYERKSTGAKYLVNPSL